jgi:hypothetical protein
MFGRKWVCLVMALCLIGVFAGVGAAQDIESFRVKFKLDTATTKGMMMGEVWVSPPQFTGAVAGRAFTVEARAVGRDAEGREVAIPAVWKSDNPGVVRVTPGKGEKVTLTIKKSGEGTVEVNYGKLTRNLAVKASSETGVMKVQIDQ